LRNRCDICIEEKCKGEKSCDCDLCSKDRECNKVLKPTIRITTRCTQACSHCCFSCSPKADDVMSLDTARQITQFLAVNQVSSVNVMGGEFFLNENWYEIIKSIASTVDRVRLVTNGDWAARSDKSLIADRLAEFFNLYVAISKDVWHTNTNVEKAEKLLKDRRSSYVIQGEDEHSIFGPFDPIVPIGRSVFDSGTFYSSFGCYCHNPEQLYSFLIDERGTIYKCPFGLWDYAEVSDFQQEGFKKEFKRVHQIFYTTFIGSC
jgi:hypothetical protein